MILMFGLFPDLSAQATEMKALYCHSHKAPSHINVRAKQCSAPNCLKFPTFGDPGQSESAPTSALTPTSLAHPALTCRRGADPCSPRVQPSASG